LDNNLLNYVTETKLADQPENPNVKSLGVQYLNTAHEIRPSVDCVQLTKFFYPLSLCALPIFFVVVPSTVETEKKGGRKKVDDISKRHCE